MNVRKRIEYIKSESTRTETQMTQIENKKNESIKTLKEVESALSKQMAATQMAGKK